MCVFHMSVCTYSVLYVVAIHCTTNESSYTSVALVAHLGKDASDPSCSQLSSKVLELMEEFPLLESSSAKTQTGITSLQLHTMAITLWNLAVTLKAKDNTSNELNAQCKLLRYMQHVNVTVQIRNCLP